MPKKESEHDKYGIENAFRERGILFNLQELKKDHDASSGKPNAEEIENSPDALKRGLNDQNKENGSDTLKRGLTPQKKQENLDIRRTVTIYDSRIGRSVTIEVPQGLSTRAQDLLQHLEPNRERKPVLTDDKKKGYEQLFGKIEDLRQKDKGVDNILKKLEENDREAEGEHGLNS